MINLTALATFSSNFLAAMIPEDSYDDTMAVAEAVGVAVHGGAS